MPAADDLVELHKEARMGALGTETQAREIRRIDLSDFENRRDEIADLPPHFDPGADYDVAPANEEHQP